METGRRSKLEWEYDQAGGLSSINFPAFDDDRYCMQTEQDWPLHDASSHITNTGKMIEEMEIKMRNLLQEVIYSIISSGAVNKSKI
jgi:F-actin capping protein, beta subunit